MALWTMRTMVARPLWLRPGRDLAPGKSDGIGSPLAWAGPMAISAGSGGKPCRTCERIFEAWATWLLANSPPQASAGFEASEDSRFGALSSHDPWSRAYRRKHRRRCRK